MHESLFLLQHSDGTVRIWRKQHESMDNMNTHSSCLVSAVQTGGGGVRDIFLAHLPVVPI